MKYFEKDKIKDAEWTEISKALWYQRLKGYYFCLTKLEINIPYQTSFAYYKKVE